MTERLVRCTCAVREMIVLDVLNTWSKNQCPCCRLQGNITTCPLIIEVAVAMGVGLGCVQKFCLKGARKQTRNIGLKFCFPCSCGRGDRKCLGCTNVAVLIFAKSTGILGIRISALPCTSNRYCRPSCEMMIILLSISITTRTLYECLVAGGDVRAGHVEQP